MALGRGLQRAALLGQKCGREDSLVPQLSPTPPHNRPNLVLSFYCLEA